MVNRTDGRSMSTSLHFNCCCSAENIQINGFYHKNKKCLKTMEGVIHLRSERDSNVINQNTVKTSKCSGHSNSSNYVERFTDNQLYGSLKQAKYVSDKESQIYDCDRTGILGDLIVGAGDLDAEDRGRLKDCDNKVSCCSCNNGICVGTKILLTSRPCMNVTDILLTDCDSTSDCLVTDMSHSDTNPVRDTKGRDPPMRQPLAPICCCENCVTSRVARRCDLQFAKMKTFLESNSMNTSFSTCVFCEGKLDSYNNSLTPILTTKRPNQYCDNTKSISSIVPLIGLSCDHLHSVADSNDNSSYSKANTHHKYRGCLTGNGKTDSLRIRNCLLVQKSLLKTNQKSSATAGSVSDCCKLLGRKDKLGAKNLYSTSVSTEEQRLLVCVLPLIYYLLYFLYF